jgi:arginine/lysine/ornithine decarboxylase
MAEAPHAKALVVTSPTYEGMTEPLEEIAALAHHHNMAVIVDAAHGAHLGFHPYFPPSPVATGADVVIMSLHKTLPSLTQTAVLHYCGQQERDSSTGVSRQRIEEYLSYFQTSSPSYVLMASICRCIRFLREQPQAFATYAELLQEYYEKFEKLKYFDISCKPGQDPSKIVIDTSKTSLTGQALMERLEQDYHLEPEMASFSYVLAMTSVMDTRQGMDRLYNALKELDAEEDGKPIRLKDQKSRSTDYLQELYAKPVKVMESWEAADRKHRIVPIIKAEGQVAAKEVALYPPGVPLLVPGEVIKKKQLLLLSEAQDMGLTVTGTEGKDKKGLSVVI